jgi:DNA-directed RNA polymerase II subunit RPB7
MIPSDIKFDGNATPPQFTDNADQVIERGTHIRVKIKGIRGEVGQMYAIATIKEDFLGYVDLGTLGILVTSTDCYDSPLLEA